MVTAGGSRAFREERVREPGEGRPFDHHRVEPGLGCAPEGELRAPRRAGAPPGPPS